MTACVLIVSSRFTILPASAGEATLKPILKLQATHNLNYSQVIILKKQSVFNYIEAAGQVQSYFRR